MEITYGLTKREYFAAMAMTGILAGADYNLAIENLSEQSVECADNLIKELNEDNSDRL